MAKKSSKHKKSEPQIANTVMYTARQIWLAGLGAFITAEEEGGKLFDALVKQGEEVESLTKKTAETKVGAVKTEVEDKVEGVKDKAIDTWEGLEQVFEDRVARVLNRLGVPTYEDIHELAKQVEILTQNINDLSKSS